MKMTYQGQPIKNITALQAIRRKLDDELHKSKRLREAYLLGYAYYIVNELDKILRHSN